MLLSVETVASKAQCKAAETMEIVENGMLLAVDSVNKTVAPAVDGELPVALVYSAEHLYDERKMGLRNFKLNAKGEDFLPRLGYLEKINSTLTASSLRVMKTL